MKFALACLIAGLALAVVANADNIRDRAGYYFEQRPRLGHFAEKPFIDLYKNYAAAFVKPNHRERSNDDFRNFLPSADDCVNFFRKFRIDEYKVKDLDQFVVLDACLGYVHTDAYHEKDKQESKQVEENLDNLIADEKLSAIYKGSNINALPEPAKECIGDLLLNSILAKAQYKDTTCNNHWIQVFVQFAECHKEIPEESRTSDTYVQEVYDLVRRRANECFNHEIGAINRAIRGDYANNPFRRMHNSLLSQLRNPLKKQTKERMYPAPIVKLLSTVQGTKKEINLREVHNIIRGVILEEPNFVNRLLDNLATRATSDIKPKRDTKLFREDPEGSRTYQRYIDNMCAYFRSSDRENEYDYATPIIRMARLLSYPEVFGISKEEFVKDLLVHSYESGALYLSVSACNVLTFTEAVYESRPQNSPLNFKVAFKPDTTQMVRWPDAGFY